MIWKAFVWHHLLSYHLTSFDIPLEGSRHEDRRGSAMKCSHLVLLAKHQVKIRTCVCFAPARDSWGWTQVLCFTSFWFFLHLLKNSVLCYVAFWGTEAWAHSSPSSTPVTAICWDAFVCRISLLNLAHSLVIQWNTGPIAFRFANDHIIPHTHHPYIRTMMYHLLKYGTMMYHACHSVTPFSHLSH
jgi:hypothetical protein